MKIKFFTKANFFCSVLILLIFFLDRFSKFQILKMLENKNNIFINDFLNFNLVFNTGIGFGLLSLNESIYYNIITFIIFAVVLLLIYFLLKSEGLEKYSFSLIVGGALGNLYDRIFNKAVPDFIDLHFANFHWFSFNIADIFISFGIILMILKEFVFKKKNNET